MSKGRVSAERHPQRPGPGPMDAPTSAPERENHLPKRRFLLQRTRRKNRINETPRDDRGRVVDLGAFKVVKDLSEEPQVSAPAFIPEPEMKGVADDAERPVEDPPAAVEHAPEVVGAGADAEGAADEAGEEGASGADDPAFD